MPASLSAIQRLVAGLARVSLRFSALPVLAAGLATGSVTTALAQTPEPLTGEIIASEGGFPDQPSVVTSQTGRFLVVWDRSNDFYRRSFNPQGAPSGGAQVLPGGEPTASGDFNGNAVVAWGAGDIQARRFGIDGSGQGAQFQVNTQTQFFLTDAAVGRAPTGEFVVSWTSSGGQDGEGYGIFAQRFSATGVLRGSEFQVNTYTTGNQVDSDVSMAPDRSFVITWYRGFGVGAGVFAQRYASTGSPLGGEFQVDGDLDNGGYFPAISHGPTGGFVVVWQVDGEEPGGFPFTLGVFGRRYASNGQPQGGSFVVNQVTASSQREPDVDHAPDGSHVVVWNSNNQDGSFQGIFARHYASNGSPRGGEFQVNVESAGNQVTPSLAVDPDGNFVIAWESDYNVIAARRFFGGILRDDFESGDLSKWSVVP